MASQTPIQRWNNKIRSLWQYLRGWSCHTIIGEIEKIVEVRPFSAQEIELKSQSNAEIAQIGRE